jgi:hypothetical protein
MRIRMFACITLLSALLPTAGESGFRQGQQYNASRYARRDCAGVATAARCRRRAASLIASAIDTAAHLTST